MFKEMNWNDAVTIASPYPYILITGRDREREAQCHGRRVVELYVGQAAAHARLDREDPLHPRMHQAHEGFRRLFPVGRAGQGRLAVRGEEREDNGQARGGRTEGQGPRGRSRRPSSRGARRPLSVKSSMRSRRATISSSSGRSWRCTATPSSPMHLYSVFYERLISMDTDGKANMALKYF